MKGLVTSPATPQLQNKQHPTDTQATVSIPWCESQNLFNKCKIYCFCQSRHGLQIAKPDELNGEEKYKKHNLSAEIKSQSETPCKTILQIEISQLK